MKTQTDEDKFSQLLALPFAMRGQTYLDSRLSGDEGLFSSGNLHSPSAGP
jgi:hypothetical protein